MTWSWTTKNDLVTVYTQAAIAQHDALRLTRGGMLLMALLSGNDYNPVSKGRHTTNDLIASMKHRSGLKISVRESAWASLRLDSVTGSVRNTQSFPR
jgi:hypothetical protein